MMDIISEYVKTIAFFMIFTAFIEIIAPSGSFKKYIRLITSLILIALLLEPISTVINVFSSESNSINLENITANNSSLAEIDRYEKDRAGAVVKEYKNNLKEQALHVIKNQTGIEVEDVSFIVNEDYGSESFAEILGIHATATIDAHSNEGDAVKKVLLGSANRSTEAETLKKAAELSIKKCLSDFYNVSEGNIHITVQEQP